MGRGGGGGGGLRRSRGDGRYGEISFTLNNSTVLQFPAGKELGLSSSPESNCMIRGDYSTVLILLGRR